MRLQVTRRRPQESDPGVQQGRQFLSCLRDVPLRQPLQIQHQLPIARLRIGRKVIIFRSPFELLSKPPSSRTRSSSFSISGLVVAVKMPTLIAGEGGRYLLLHGNQPS